MAKVKDLKTSVTIADGFPGTYKYTGGTSYYLNGITGAGEIHFSVNESANSEFTKFHLSYSISGTNIGIWFVGDTRSGKPNVQSLPSFKMDQWKSWWETNQKNVENAGREFWKNVHPS